MPNDEGPTLLQMLAEGVKAYDAWDPMLADGGRRLEARQQQRLINARIADLLTVSPVDVARLLLALDERLSTVERELDPEHVGLAARVEYLSERMSGE